LNAQLEQAHDSGGEGEGAEEQQQEAQEAQQQEAQLQEAQQQEASVPLSRNTSSETPRAPPPPPLTRFPRSSLGSSLRSCGAD
jgi:hypothetical protein